MNNINDQIVKRIKDARIERDLTQKDLAEHLQRTAASISDLERGKVQVSASDLYKLAKLLGKPIEYFFGEKFAGKDIEDLTALIRKMDPEVRALQVPIIKSLLDMQMSVSVLTSKDEDDIEDDEIKEIFQETYDDLIKYLLNVRQLYEMGLDIKSKLEEKLEISNNELPSIE
jgi:transcriptional regulator with XRE-family HTH domain